ncbi:MAG: hypothetical protein ABH827_03775 [bacterium]
MNLFFLNKFYIKISVLFFAIIINISFFNVIVCGENKNDFEQKLNARQAVLELIKDLNLRTFDRDDDHYDCQTLQEYIELCLQLILNPKPVELRENAFKFLKVGAHISDAHENQGQVQKQENGLASCRSDKKDNVTWQNLDLFSSQEKNANYVAKALDRMCTEIGRVVFFEQLAYPIIGVDILKKRQNIIKTCVQNTELAEHLDALLVRLQESEKVMLSFWDNQGIGRSFQYNLEGYHVVGKWLQNVYGLKELNSSKHALLLKNIRDYIVSTIGVTTGAISAAVLIYYGARLAFSNVNLPGLEDRAGRACGSAGLEFPYLWDFTNNRWVRSSVALTGGVLCAVGTWENIKQMRNNVLIEQAAYIFMLNIARYLSISKKLYGCIKTSDILYKFEDFAGLIKFFEQDIKTDEQLGELMNLIETSTLQGSGKNLENIEILFNRGVVIRFFDLFIKEHEKLHAMMIAIGKLDMYASCAKLYKEFEHKQVCFCFPEYVETQKPFIKMQEFWHLLIDSEKVVSNSVTLGTDGQRQNLIITGPNAGGKSCILKAVTLSLLLAQTIGIAPAKSLAFTPFKLISTYLNIADDINAGSSLFKSEVLRAQELLDRIQGFGPGEFAFTVYDEIFKGTSPVEGTAAAYGVAKLLGTLDNSICLIATHFGVLTELEQETDNFSNYKVTVNKRQARVLGGVSIEYPFKLVTGLSDQHVALDILQNEGITGSVVQDAKKIIDKQNIVLLKKS